jgi:hypothetical protein
MLGRTNYTTEAEQEAELTARLILARAHAPDDRSDQRGRSPSPAAGAEPAMRAIVRRIEEILG